MAPLLYPSAGSGLASTANNEHAAHIVDQGLKAKICHSPYEHEAFLQRSYTDSNNGEGRIHDRVAGIQCRVPQNL